MATVTKDFRVKHGLVVEGTNATVDGSDIITEDIITGGTQTNISVTYNPSTKLLDFVAENGVADSDTDDLAEGTTNLYYTEARARADAAELLVGATKTNITITGDGDSLIIAAENGVADSTTDDLDEGSTNRYFTDLRARQVLSGGDGIDYDGTSGTISADIVSSSGLKITSNKLDLDRTIIDTWYEASNAVADHSELTTGVHGVTGDVVGTTDTQDLSNKRVIDTLYFTDGVTIANEAEVAVKPTTHEFEIKANYGNLDLKTVATNADVNITSQDGDIILDADGSIYSNSVLAENELITQGRLDSYLGDVTVDGSSGNTVTDRIATAVSDLVNGAPELLDTLNELAAAIGDDESFATTIATDIGTKVSKAGDTMTGALAMGTNKITGLGTPTDDYDAATKKYTDDTFVTLEDLPGQLDDYVPLAQKAAADGVATLDEDGQVPVTQLAHVTEAIDGLSTDDIEEGDTNLYFTDARAVTALEAVVPTFTEINLNSVGRQVASNIMAESGDIGQQLVLYSFDKQDYNAAKFLVKFSNGTHVEISELLIAKDSSGNIAITEYGIVSTNGSLSTISADTDSTDIRLLVTPAYAGLVTAIGTIIY